MGAARRRCAHRHHERLAVRRAAVDADAIGVGEVVVVEYALGQPVGEYAAVGQQRQPVAVARGGGEVVHDRNHPGAVAGAGAQHRHDVERMGRIEPGHGFVGEQHAGLDRECARQQHAGPFAAR